ncbi:MAG: peptidyl-prolyl cis-trans isomerase [Tepidisphaeraceae bacterium]|jgi:hypothetical protein
MARPLLFVILLPLGFLCACGSEDHPRPLSPDQFYSNNYPAGSSALPGYGEGGQLPAPDVQARPPLPPLASGGVNQGVAESTPAYQTPSQPASASTRATTLPSPEALSRINPSSDSNQPEYQTEQYMTLGTVVAVVGDTPIYANDVIQRDAPILRELAKEYDIDRFEIAARQRIDETTKELEYDQLEYQAALKALNSQDKDMADRLTDMWRQRKITEAGGSLEVARRRALAEGKDFSQQVEEQHRAYMIQIYQARTIFPQVQVTANDKRRYYLVHLATEFSKPDTATVWIIHTDPADLGPDLALSRIRDFRKRALAGEDFGNMAKLQDSSLFTDPRTIERHSFALTKCEDAIWTLAPGQVSDIIQDNGGYYLIKLITLQKGGVQPFEDEAVQDQITRTLRSQQMARLNEEMMSRLLENAVVRTDPSMIDAAVDMVMQNYTKWSQK